MTILPKFNFAKNGATLYRAQTAKDEWIFCKSFAPLRKKKGAILSIFANFSLLLPIIIGGKANVVDIIISRYR